MKMWGSCFGDVDIDEIDVEIIWYFKCEVIEDYCIFICWKDENEVCVNSYEGIDDKVFFLVKMVGEEFESEGIDNEINVY